MTFNRTASSWFLKLSFDMPGYNYKAKCYDYLPKVGEEFGFVSSLFFWIK